MPETKVCDTCGGSGVEVYLKNTHSDETESGTCHDCGGSGKKHYMSDEDEADYYAGYW